MKVELEIDHSLTITVDGTVQRVKEAKKCIKRCFFISKETEIDY